MTLNDPERRDASGLLFGGPPYVRSHRLTNNNQIWHGNPRGDRKCFRGQPRLPIQMGGVPAHPNLFGPPLLTIKFSMAIHVAEGRVLRGHVTAYSTNASRGLSAKIEPSCLSTQSEF